MWCRTPSSPGGRKVTALMQLAAYADQLDRLGIPRADRVELLLGDGTISAHEVDDLLPVFVLRRERLRAMIAIAATWSSGADGPVVAWGDPRFVACGRCATCTLEVEGHRDLLLVAGMRPTQRRRLQPPASTRSSELAGADACAANISPDAFASLRTQARLQLESERGAAAGGPTAPVFEVVMPAAWRRSPRPIPATSSSTSRATRSTPRRSRASGTSTTSSAGSTRPSSTARSGRTRSRRRSGRSSGSSPSWASAGARIRGLHIYHYAPYEPTHLLAMAARYGVLRGRGRHAAAGGRVRRPVPDRAPRAARRIPVVLDQEARAALHGRRRAHERGAEGRRVDRPVRRGQRAAGRTATPSGAQRIFDDIAEYNRDDCVSTLRLRDWLRALAAQFHVRAIDDSEPRAGPTSRRHGRSRSRGAPTQLQAATRAGGAEKPTADERALRLAGAAIDYYPREAKSFWAMHFLRLREPISLWEDARDVVRVDADQTEVVRDWHRDDGQRTDRRHLLSAACFAPGTRLSPDTNPYLLYELPTPFPFTASPRWIHGDHRCRVLEVLRRRRARRGVGRRLVHVVGAAGRASRPPPRRPRATSRSPSRRGRMRCSTAALEFPADPATDILRLRPPRTRSGALAPVIDGDDVTAITASLLDLDRSYLAVQGPPGTGKTYVGSHVIARLVHEHGWRIGVVAQSHAVVENMLDRVVEAGVAAELVGKAPKKVDEPGRHAYTALAKNGVAAFAAERAESGFVVGGTAWDFSHEGRAGPRRPRPAGHRRGRAVLPRLDDRRLARRAAPAAARRPAAAAPGEPGHASRTGRHVGPRLGDRRPRRAARPLRVLPHAELAHAPGRRARRCRSSPTTGGSPRTRAPSIRRVEGIEPGLHVEPVLHHGNTTESVEEAARVAAIVAGLIGSPYTDVDTDRDGSPTARAPRPLEPRDIIVVTPYNAQLTQVEKALADAGFPDVPVGTVDKFQGQEAAVAIVSLAASSAADAPRGHRVPAAAQPPERRDLAGEGGRVPRVLARSAR